MTFRFAIGTLLIGGLIGCAAPADSSLPSTSPTAHQSDSSVPAETSSATAMPSQTPLPPATPVATAGALGGELIVPGFADVIADQLLMRQEPGLTGEPLMNHDTCIDNPDPNCARPFLIGTESGFLELYVYDGPVEADGYEWYLAATEMHTEVRASMFPDAVGWVAAGDGVDAWLVAASRSCPSEPVELADVTLLSMTRLEMLHCFGRQALTLRGWYPELPPGEGDPDAALEECRADRAWLLCYSVFDMLRPEPADWAGNADYLPFVLDPGAGVTVPGRPQWVELTGSFDHPASTDCGDAALVLVCRSSFVVSSAIAQ